MRFLSICLLVLGVVVCSRASEEQLAVEDYEDVLEAPEEDTEDVDLPDFPEEDSEDTSTQDADAEDDGFRESLLEAFKTWNADVRACDSDETCLARVNSVLRPMVNEAADRGVLSVIDPCEDRVGTYEVETVDGWTIEATLPC